MISARSKALKAQFPIRKHLFRQKALGESRGRRGSLSRKEMQRAKRRKKTKRNETKRKPHRSIIYRYKVYRRQDWRERIRKRTDCTHLRSYLTKIAPEYSTLYVHCIRTCPQRRIIVPTPYRPDPHLHLHLHPHSPPSPSPISVPILPPQSTF
ncbi:hypothetical protein M430DRAFT_171332 [Amorphotheca resinae ATCC 22711]|uniref:Uncharacterized protein n=1 Tax=Amorphotheca resinae ATCC 22711 TaxID=857342 RepID=A0A2T3AUX4_AMORE|nr:hypothetical protein M430DRAFT_171332 [Amorphotheca resinae ATCC 22711]PSS12454.1 hypothetical protein M430DRAFT_171332 [Amorphotheca resinae ATCC 22711]